MRQIPRLARVLGYVLGICISTFSFSAHADESLVLFFQNDAVMRATETFPHEGHGRRSTRVEHRRGSARGDGLGMLSGVSAPLAAKAREIVSACGSTIISGYRHTHVAHSGRMSLHASGRAVDIRGNPSCIYAQLKGWPGGYSTDYGRVQHVHISLGGSEDGLRFTHGGGHTRFAHSHHHRHRRYAAL